MNQYFAELSLILIKSFPEPCGWVPLAKNRQFWVYILYLGNYYRNLTFLFLQTVKKSRRSNANDLERALWSEYPNYWMKLFVIFNQKHNQNCSSSHWKSNEAVYIICFLDFSVKEIIQLSCKVKQVRKVISSEHFPSLWVSPYNTQADPVTNHILESLLISAF